MGGKRFDAVLRDTERGARAEFDGPSGTVATALSFHTSQCSVVERVLGRSLGVTMSVLQTAPGSPWFDGQLISDGQVTVFEFSLSVAAEMWGCWHADAFIVLFSLDGWHGAYYDSRALGDDECLLIAPAVDCWRLQPAGVRVAGMAIAWDALQEIPSLHRIQSSARDGNCHRGVRLPNELCAELRAILGDGLSTVVNEAFAGRGSRPWQALRDRCIDSAGATLRQDEPHAGVGRPVASYKQMVRKVRDMVQDGSRVAPSVEELCGVLHVSPRTLQYAFQKSLGVSAAAYVRSLRLDQVRRTLLEADPGSLRVGDVAVRWGFWHASQFSRLYARQFGELPSETLAVRRVANGGGFGDAL